MDSFYDQPRRAPLPKAVTSSSDRVLPNTVPDASLLLQNKGNIIQKKNEMSYNAWKYQLRNGGANKVNKENKAPITVEPTPSILRKQVRFESPQPIHVANTYTPNYNMNPLRPTITNKHMNSQPVNPMDPSAMPRQENRNILQAKPFDKIYMANIPNRSLDLSMIEGPKHGLHRSNSAPECYPNANGLHAIPKINEDKMTTAGLGIRPLRAESTTLEIRKSQEVQAQSDEPTMKDLLKIIQQQNEQIICLQQQVTTLLRERSEQPQITAAPATQNINNLIASPFRNKALDLGGKQQIPNKFAIDVMTSFEVSIRGPKCYGNRNQLFNSPTKINQARITEVMEPTTLDSCSNNGLNDTAKQSNELSLKLDDPVLVSERCPSPENSIHVDMKDFSSDEDDSNSGVNNSMIGWTIYNNVMDQVNCMLKKSVEQNRDNANCQYDKQKDPQATCTGAILKQVREATMKHLKRVGVNLRNTEDLETIASNDAYSPSQVSFAVKQLLLKYLPEEQLQNLTKPQENVQQMANCAYPQQLIKRRPDFSMATVQYMEKYNLLNKAGTKPKKTVGDKMLDITALRQQPKLI